MLKKLLFIIMVLSAGHSAIGQLFPSEKENLDYFVTFGKDAPKKYGDDDFAQVYFFLVPEDYPHNIYIKVFDPDISEDYDELIGDKLNSRTLFSVFGGKGAHSDKDAREANPFGDYKTGRPLASKRFTRADKYNGKWYSFGPFKPSAGEYNKQFKGYIFKMVVEGLSGDDANLYRFFLSSSEKQNSPIEGGNGFTYEHTFRLVSKPGTVAHLFPYIDKKVKILIVNNFDFDADAVARLYSLNKNGVSIDISGDNDWAKSTFEIFDEEKERSMDMQIIKRGNWHNDASVHMTNEDGHGVPLFAYPMGSMTSFKYTIEVVYHKDKK